MIIYKYKLSSPNSLIEMPTNSRIISAGVQNDIIVVWALVDPTFPLCKRHVIAINTDDNFELGMAYDFIGTVTTSVGIVWHVFSSNIEQ